MSYLVGKYNRFTSLFSGVRGSTCSQVAGTVTSYHIAEQARFLPVRVPMKAFIAVVAGNAICKMGYECILLLVLFGPRHNKPHTG